MYDFRKFINDNKEAVLNACKGTGFFPSVMMGQISLEASAIPGKTSYGYHKLSYLPFKYNNYNGIKFSSWMLAHGVTESPRINTVEHTADGSIVTIKPTWAVFRNLEHNVNFKITLLKRVKVYQKQKVFDAVSPLDQLNRLWNNGKGYATDRTYPTKVMNIINSYGLTSLDEELKKKIALETAIKILPANENRINRVMSYFFKMKNYFTPTDSTIVQP